MSDKKLVLEVQKRKYKQGGWNKESNEHETWVSTVPRETRRKSGGLFYQ